MTTHPGPDPTDEAISWQIRLTDAPDDPALRAACQAWQDASPENGQAWRKAERIRRLAGAAVRAEVAAPRHSAPRPRALPTASARRPPFRRPLAAATAIAATLVMAVSLGPTLYDRFTADYTTGVADSRQLTLADGSEVLLSAETAISIRMAADRRQVTLIRGEALFTVRHDDRRPFLVHAGSMTTRDIGTIFEVERNGPHRRVAVREGTVGVMAPTAGLPEETRLAAGEQIELTEGSTHIGRQHVDPATIGSWHSGLLSVDSTSLSDLIATFRRYYPGYVVVHGPLPAMQRVGGVYDLRHPADALRMLGEAHGASVSEYGGHLLVMSFRDTTRTP